MTERALLGLGYHMAGDNFFAQWDDDTVTYHESSTALSSATLAFGKAALAKDGTRESGAGWRDAALAAIADAREVDNDETHYWRPQGPGS